ncbi:uncharacterized protein MELLADRAFT_104038 [Melampsora larici-populina 98AG31]|uniref:Uncharacterized protein n=1 Tax=Melampsora larici-populina (strain 98AG31 / pathotype 3-4-7) TaxID=747676 RepID=F4RDC7_MELLP|nr:uncharacterized protein MELLADRAFT_104038 [Melampsora larici-populina 98AG31]EGG09378.1 hypothetical protein MELLADRAFT_104038 [Melampsora larici-populina 98AG31]
MSDPEVKASDECAKTNSNDSKLTHIKDNKIIQDSLENKTLNSFNVFQITFQFIQIKNLSLSEIAANKARPDQIKHLETATSRFLNLELDLVQLGIESYHFDFRIPSDIGLEDLKNGLTRTPFPALETLQDDPLRLLCCIRFSSRYGFRLDDQIIQAAQCDQITVRICIQFSPNRI